MAEKDSAKFEIVAGLNLSEYRTKIKEAKDLYQSLKKAFKSTDVSDGNTLSVLEKQLERQTTALKKLQTLYNDFGMKNFRKFQNLLDGRTATGQGANRQQWLNSLAKNLGTVGAVLQTVKTDAEGLAAALERARMQGEGLKQVYGTDWGRASVRISQEKDRIRRQTEVRDWNEGLYTKVTQARSEDKTARDIEYLRRRSLTQEQRDAEDYAKSQEKLQKRLGSTQLQVMANYYVINRLTGAFRNLINYTVQYDEELHQLQAISSMSNASLSKTRETIESVAVSTEFTSLELAKASTVLAQAGLSATQIQGTLPAIAKLATATGTDLATSTDVITSTLNVYNLQVSEAEKVTNSLTTAMNESKATIPGFQTAIQYAGNTASQLGMSFEETAAAISAATQAGIRSKSMLGTGLRAVLTEFLKPTPKLIAQLEKLGLTVEDIDVKTKGYVNVLKTLKQAGFGVEEAYRGMERRGAAFLVSQLNQTDFMDELRLKMAGSTAASKANETQMDALAKQIKNFQNVLGTAATQGLEPFIRLLSDALKIINSISQTKIGGGLFSLLTVGVGSMATVKSWQMLTGSFKGLIRGLGVLTGSSKVFERFISLKGLNMSGWDKLTSWVTIFTKNLGPAGWIGIGATAISLIYQLAESMQLFTSEAEKAQQQLEEFQGKLEESRTEQEAIQGFRARLIRDSEKLKDPTERNIFLQEILTRLPEANKYLNESTNSVEDFRKALEALNNTNLQKITDNLREIAEASGAALPMGAEEVAGNIGWRIGGKEAQGLLRAYGALRRAAPGMTTSVSDLFYGSSNRSAWGMIQSSRLERAYANNDPEAYRIAKGITAGRNLSENLNNLMNDLIEQALKNPQLHSNKDIAGWFDMLSVQKELETLAPLLKKVADHFRDLDNAFESGNLSALADSSIGSQSSNRLEMLNDTIESLTKEYKGISDLTKFGGELSPDAIKQLQTLYNQAMSVQKDLKNFTGAESFEDIGKALGVDPQKIQEIKDNTDSLKSMTYQEFIKAWNSNNSNPLIEATRDSAIGIIQAIEDLAASQKLVLAGIDIAQSQEIFDKSLKDITSAPTKAKAEEAAKLARTNAQAIYENANNQLAENLNLTDEQRGEAIEAIGTKLRLNMDKVNQALNQAGNGFDRFKNKLDPLNTELKLFFDGIDTRIKKISTTYRDSIRVLDQAIARQEGLVTAAGRIYGSGSVVSEAASIRQRKLEESQLGARTTALVTQRNSLRELREYMVNAPEFTKAGEFLKQRDAYEAALASGNAGEALRLQKQLNSASANDKKMASKYDELTKSIDELDEEIVKNNTILEQINASRNASVGSELSGGFNDAVLKYRDSVENQGFTTIRGSMAYMTGGVLDELDSGFTSLFQNIISNSKRAGDAFKDFGRQVLETIRDIAIQMAVKQGLSALFGAFATEDMSGQSSGWNPANLIPTAKPKANGGLVKGPVPNRDSVNTKLMPGEYVLKKSAVDVIGRDYLDSLNNNASATLSASAESINDARSDTNSNSDKGTGGVVNVYVVGQEEQQSMTPSDVLVTITQDMLTGGQTKRLVKQIAMGAI